MDVNIKTHESNKPREITEVQWRLKLTRLFVISGIKIQTKTQVPVYVQMPLGGNKSMKKNFYVTL